jgi:hypothetical protein
MGYDTNKRSLPEIDLDSIMQCRTRDASADQAREFGVHPTLGGLLAKGARLMIRRIAVAAMILAAAAVPALAQGGPPQGSQPPPVLEQTGTMYDGNNANLRLPPEPNAYWSKLWAEPAATGNSGAASAVGAGAAGTSLGGTTGGGEH